MLSKLTVKNHNWFSTSITGYYCTRLANYASIADKWSCIILTLLNTEHKGSKIKQ